ncbi:MAG: MBOAT family protein [Oligoflexia bacterium]|nr:MBOAT family protein [Oligoflexia bacterium]
MIYSNPEFLILLIPTALLFLLLNSYSLRFYLLLISSLLFYAWAGIFDTIVFVSVILFSWLSLWAAHKWPLYKKLFVTVGISIMTLHLFFWKYTPWLTEQLQFIFPNLNGGKKLELPLPIGISFFTLQGIGYLVDYAKGKASFISLKEFAFFKSFFPQLVAGPIIRMRQILPQMQVLEKPQADQILDGIALFCFGFFKKIMIADSCAYFVDTVFANPIVYGRGTLFLALMGFTVQVWGDFSGYTTMGRGAGKILGIELPENFLSPYLASSPSEFWRRWHITLSEWIRDYIHIPLRGRSRSELRALAVLALTMVISGLWHGANWTFMICGLIHGLLLVVERLLLSWKTLQSRLEGWSYLVKKIFNIVLLQSCIIFAWLIFRADSFYVIKIFISNFLSGAKDQIVTPPSGHVYLSIFLCYLIQIIFYTQLKSGKYVFIENLKNKFEHLKTSRPLLMGLFWGGLLSTLFALSLVFRYANTSQRFIYFKF